MDAYRLNAISLLLRTPFFFECFVAVVFLKTEENKERKEEEKKCNINYH